MERLDDVAHGRAAHRDWRWRGADVAAAGRVHRDRSARLGARDAYARCGWGGSYCVAAGRTRRVRRDRGQLASVLSTDGRTGSAAACGIPGELASCRVVLGGT